MTLLQDLSTLSPSAQKVLGPKAPAPLRAMAAKGVMPGIKPAELVAVVAALATGDDEQLALTARTTLAALPAPVLTGALDSDLEPWVIEALAHHYAHRDDVLERLLTRQRIADSTVEHLAATGSERVTELVATNEARLLQYPSIIEKLYMNKRARMSTADRLIELAVRNRIELSGIPAFKEAVLAIQDELIPEPTDEPTPDDIAFRDVAAEAEALGFDPHLEDTHTTNDEGEEVVTTKVLPLHAKISRLTLSAKIRTALLGTAAERMLLVRDTNKLVASAAIRSPQVQEPEVVRITQSRQVHDEVLRIVAQQGEWLKNHQIKYNLVVNPRTPFAFTARLIPHLREHELKSLVKNKNVTGAVQTAARQHLQRKGKTQQ